MALSVVSELVHAGHQCLGQLAGGQQPVVELVLTAVSSISSAVSSISLQ